MNEKEYYQMLFRNKLKIIIPLFILDAVALAVIAFSLIGILPWGFLLPAALIWVISFICVVFILISLRKKAADFIKLNPDFEINKKE